ncbi:MAG TPA: response regulator [Gemmatimonadales bacterium]
MHLEGPSPEILVVDDDLSVASIAARYLSRSGFRVMVAQSGAEALQALGDGAGGVRLVMTDVDLGDMTGLHLAQELSIRYPQVRVLFTAEHSYVGIATPLLMKPFVSIQLLNAVHRSLNDPTS